MREFTVSMNEQMCWFELLEIMNNLHIYIYVVFVTSIVKTLSVSLSVCGSFYLYVSISICL